MRAKLKDIKAELRRRMHWPVSVVAAQPRKHVPWRILRIVRQERTINT